MSVLINPTIRVIKPLFTHAMDKSVKILRLEERLNQTEHSLRQGLKAIEDIKRELSSLKNSNDDIGQKRSYSTSSVDLTDHCYTNGYKKLKHSFDMSGDYVKVFTDGACPNNGKRGAKAGIGIWFGDNHPLNIAMACPGRQTNNTAEILACAEACKVASVNGVDKLEINTDSKFVIDCITKWMQGWKKKGWKTAAGKDVINKDDLLILERCANALKDVKYVHVAGHAGITGNEEADRLAVQGASM